VPWIRFDRDERPAPSLPLQTADGKQVSISDYRGRASLVLIFAHDAGAAGAGCAACRELIEACSAGRREIEALGGELLIVAPSHDNAANDGAARNGEENFYLMDPGGKLHSRFAHLLEFDTSGKMLIYILDEHGVPYAAWVGDEPDSPALCYDIQRWLLYVSIQCPE
jgi:peroxiredoxin